MAVFTNESGGTLVLDDQRSIAPGAEAQVTADGQKNPAVARWISEGKLVEKKASKAKDA